MGHGMAKNLRQKLPETCLLVVYDINKETMQRFIHDYGQADNIKPASSPREISEVTVSIFRPFFNLIYFFIFSLRNYRMSS